MGQPTIFPCLLGAIFLAGFQGAATLSLHRQASSASYTEGPLLEVEVALDTPDQAVTLVVNSQEGKLSLVSGTNAEHGVAWAKFEDKLDSDGWTWLHVEAADSSSVDNTMRMYGAGYVEGILTATRISQFYTNIWQGAASGGESAVALSNVKVLFSKMIKYMKTKTLLSKGLSAEEPQEQYWRHVRYMLTQLWGIKDGYNAMAKKNGVRSLTLLDLLVINSHAVLPEYIEAFTPAAVDKRKETRTVKSAMSLLNLARQANRSHANASWPPSSSSSFELPKLSAEDADRDWEMRLAKHGHCSALIRLTAESKDLLVGHSTWGDYTHMTRVYKYYKIELPETGTAASRVSFSSYPGCIASTDNFYMMNSGLVAMDTSLEVLNPNIYNRIPNFETAPFIPNFMHVMVVNRMANSAADWTSMLSHEGTGFPSSQWMVVDFNRFTPGTPITQDTVRLLEQVPGIIRHDDVSQLVRENGFWASYNRPFFSAIRDVSGHTDAQATYGDLYSFAKSPRALIFERAAPSIIDLTGMRSLMRRNAFPEENILPNEPGHAISARLDLDQRSHIPNGGIDSKVINRCLMKELQCQAESGPSHDKQPVFSWTSPAGGELFPGWPHLGMPNSWNFGWVQMTPSTLLDTISDTC